MTSYHDHDHELTFVSEETFPDLKQINPQARLIYTVLKSMCLKDGIEYYSERINIDGQNCLLQTIKGRDDLCLHGMGSQAEDPRLVLYHDQIYAMINIVNPHKENNRLMCITPYNEFKPVVLKIKDVPINGIEKNWTPLVKDDQLYLIYTFDPLVVIRYDFNPEGLCELVFAQSGVTFPLTTYRYLRGGSNMLPLGDRREVYFGLCHSRIEADYQNIGGYPYPYYLPHLIVIDTNNGWKVVYLSKPLRFAYNGGQLIFDEGPWMTTLTPNSLNKVEDGYLVTININEARCLKFLLSPNVPVSNDDTHEIGYWDQLAKTTAISLVQHTTGRPSTYH
jgi:hypothetical protein